MSFTAPMDADSFAIAITCPPLTAPTNGSVTYSSTSDENGNYAFNAMANHSCGTGFVLIGNNTRTCTGDGSSTIGVFNGEAAICARKRTQNITVNTYLMYSYIHECHLLLQWMLIHFTIAITCPPLTAPTIGSVTYSSTSDENGNYAFNAIANHSCDTGFVLVGNNTRTCTGDGSSTTGVFDGEVAICDRKLTQNITVNTYLTL